MPHSVDSFYSSYCIDRQKLFWLACMLAHSFVLAYVCKYNPRIFICVRNGVECYAFYIAIGNSIIGGTLRNSMWERALLCHAIYTCRTCHALKQFVCSPLCSEDIYIYVFMFFCIHHAWRYVRIRIFLNKLRRYIYLCIFLARYIPCAYNWLIYYRNNSSSLH